MIGCIAVMILLLIVMVHIIRVGLKATRMFDMLLCIGVGSAVVFQTFINIGMCIGIRAKKTPASEKKRVICSEQRRRDHRHL